MKKKRGDRGVPSVPSRAACRYVFAPEGEFVAAFHPAAARWISEPLTPAGIRSIRETLAPSLEIPLTPRGFVRAADRVRPGETDPIGYDAVWVRDAVWAWFALREDPRRRGDARRLLLALWDYYGSRAQIARFDDVLARPEHGEDRLRVPHIRFDGNSPSLDDVTFRGKPVDWNHKQNDAHGLFLIALAAAAWEGSLTARDLTAGRYAALLRFPAFFDAIRFERYEDAGAWEEIDRRNTSSIGLVTRALQLWRALAVPAKGDGPAGPFVAALRKKLGAEKGAAGFVWREECLSALAARGLAAVRRQLELGGESPDYDPGDIRYRQADACLIALLFPSPLEGLTGAERRSVLQIVDTLKRPAGVIRYVNDSYQSGNAWIRRGERQTPAAPVETADASGHAAFLDRFRGFIPHTEAQWFFDSLLVPARLEAAFAAEDPLLKKRDLFLAAVHLKRALGQLTGNMRGEEPVAADGAAVPTLLPPESINTVILRGKALLLPSPVVPLNWARAALALALNRLEMALPGEGLS